MFSLAPDHLLTSKSVIMCDTFSGIKVYVSSALKFMSVPAINLSLTRVASNTAARSSLAVCELSLILAACHHRYCQCVRRRCRG